MKLKLITSLMLAVIFIGGAFVYNRGAFDDLSSEKDWQSELNEVFGDKYKQNTINKTSSEREFTHEDHSGEDEISPTEYKPYINEENKTYFESERIRIFSEHRDKTNYLKVHVDDEDIVLASGGDGSEITIRGAFSVGFRNVKLFQQRFVVYEVGYYEGSEYFIYDLEKRKNIFRSAVTGVYFTEDGRHFYTCDGIGAYTIYGASIYNSETEEKEFDLVKYIQETYKLEDGWAVSRAFPTVECSADMSVINITLNNQSIFYEEDNKPLKFIKISYNAEYKKPNITDRNILPKDAEQN